MQIGASTGEQRGQTDHRHGGNTPVDHDADVGDTSGTEGVQRRPHLQGFFDHHPVGLAGQGIEARENLRGVEAQGGEGQGGATADEKVVPTTTEDHCDAVALGAPRGLDHKAREGREELSQMAQLEVVVHTQEVWHGHARPPAEFLGAQLVIDFGIGTTRITRQHQGGVAPVDAEHTEGAQPAADHGVVRSRKRLRKRSRSATR